MAIYGRPEIEFYQITPVGLQRIQTGTMPGVSPEAKRLLKEIAQLGGTAEIDELKFRGTYDSPAVLRVALNRLMDLGYITPVVATPPAQQTQGAPLATPRSNVVMR